MHAGLCWLRVGKSHAGKLSDLQSQGGGQSFSVEPVCKAAAPVAPMATNLATVCGCG
jgi:hypothetical protein